MVRATGLLATLLLAAVALAGCGDGDRVAELELALAAAPAGCRWTTNSARSGATRRGVSTSWPASVDASPYQESLDHFHEVFRADDEQKVSMRKAYEMTRAVNHGLEQQRQQEITEYLEEGSESRCRSRSPPRWRCASTRGRCRLARMRA